jgi:CelD/BcsL family acetyltransferase involved in cellulose biosynthesis/GNAT superfamily N-acetyltransferase
MSASAYKRTFEDAMPVSVGVAKDPTPKVQADTVAPGQLGGVTTTCISDLESLERALVEGPLRDWQRLAEETPHSSIFQTPAWCMPWYRCYPTHTPFVVVVTAGERLVGVVPLEVNPDTGALDFASNNVADYRDIVALPNYRRRVVEALIDAHRAGGFPSPLPVGWLDPASDTPALLEQICRERGLRFRVRHQPCYRWFPPPPSKPSAQKFLNWYKRQGDVSFEVVDSDAAWLNFKDEYYRLHSLRQVAAGRPQAFDDARRTAFYEQLFHSSDLKAHVTAFRLDGRLLAGHFGYVWRDVLSLGPPALRLEDEQRSPAVILLAWIIQNAETLELRGFDLTIGDSDFKKRLGNQCVQLTMVDVYASSSAYRRDEFRATAMNMAKRVVARVAGPSTWDDRLKPSVEKLAYKVARVREEGLVGAARTGIRSGIGFVAERRRGHVYAIAPADVRDVAPRLAADERLEFHENTVSDLLLWNGRSLTAASDISMCARSYSRSVAAGRTLHTVVVNGQLAGWGYSYYPDRPAQLTETPGATLTFEAGAVSLYDFHVLPEFRGRKIYQALLVHILRQRFSEGAPVAYITVLADNTASRTAIERVGFRLIAANEYRRVLRREQIRPVAVP